MIQIDVKVTRSDVCRFLRKLSEVINDPKFDFSKNFWFSQKAKNMQTLVNLGFDTKQVVDHLRSLTVEEFSEVVIDKDNENPPFLWIFGRNIDTYKIYIKIKIRESEDKTKVICISFHEAEHPMSFPYK